MTQDFHKQSPDTIIATWLEFEASGISWKRIGPKGLENCGQTFNDKLEREVWCCRVCDQALSAMYPRGDLGLTKAFCVHSIHMGKPVDSFPMSDVVNGPRLISKFRRYVEAAAKAMPPRIFVEAE